MASSEGEVRTRRVYPTLGTGALRIAGIKIGVYSRRGPLRNTPTAVVASGSASAGDGPAGVEISGRPIGPAAESFTTFACGHRRFSRDRRGRVFHPDGSSPGQDHQPEICGRAQL